MGAITDRASLIACMAQCRDPGREASRATDGYADGRSYVVPADGRRYDAKGIVSAAHGGTMARPLRAGWTGHANGQDLSVRDHAGLAEGVTRERAV